ncbi:MAG TPA: molybdopterin-dependent oxidoreductase [Actinomycetota bacterium]|nr:molybdopterin-dependent oxidoreductase [Actinomycetota bacterium]
MRKTSTPSERGGRAGPGATTGLVTGAVAIGVAHLVAGVVNPQASPLITVGQATIDATPEWLKSFAIRTFGSSDKLVLLWSMGVVLALISVGLGIASTRRLRFGVAGLVGFGALGVAAALSRPSARPADALPAIVGAAAAAGALVALRRSFGSAGSSRSTRSDAPEMPGGVDRRRFLLTAAGATAAGAAAGGLGGFLGRRFRADESRAAVRIPAPASTAAAPAGLDLAVPGVGPFFTPNGSFYRVDTALLVPSLMAEDWKLRIHGMVDHEITLDYEQLLSRPLIERDITLTCVSNPVGGEYAGNARWIGAPLKQLLEEAGVHPGADQIVTRSVDGFTIGTPTAVAMDGRDAMLAIAMNGEPLPLAHGFPVRMIVPGLYGYVSAMKWLTDMELTTFDAFDPYWIERGWAERGPIKTMSRIDTPAPLGTVPVGEIPIAGVAWAQHTGIDRVEVQIDDGNWMPAELSAEDTIDTWRQWVLRWRATAGEHRVSVRATDRTGFTQTEERREPFPDGATGQHTIVVHVTA